MDIRRFKILYFPFLFLMMLSFMTFGAIASEPIAKVSQFKGEVVILSGGEFIKVTEIGQPVREGDRIQTEEGEAEVTFNDGAVLKIRPYANIMIQEGEEKSGLPFFEKKSLVRRITCYVGTLRFKSGASKRQNYLQTPTAVCGLRGSEMDFGFDNLMTYISEIEGSADARGEIRRVAAEFFRTLQANAQSNAQANALFGKLQTAYGLSQTAPGSDEAEIAKLEALKLSIELLLQNEHLSDAARALLLKALEETVKDLADLGVTVTTTVTTTKPTTTTSTTEKSPAY
jgi:hypothetical protein